ncbi:family 10 glycosylhydrolase [Paenibacillus guangzhouensis]|uniref:family 10 glycosylhydrolase n=1 Tax=Paenibacillus guangzhouensis TaxID=1473112 RepID=UPI001266AC27|nr:family 10 glycosylhydrolase [Paenibacillus guangzhouensis]
MKFSRTILIALMMLLMIPSWTAFAASQTKEIALFLNDRQVATDVPPYLAPRTNVTMVPLRVISESLGATVDWKDRTATIYQNNNTLILQEKDRVANVNGNEVKLDEAVTIRDSRVLVPLRFVAENLGVTVVWDGASRTISMTSSTGNDDTYPNPDPTPNPNPNPKPNPNPSQEMRGAWVSTVYNLDWPSKAGLQIEQQKAEFTKLLDDLKNVGMNAVFVQVRAASDAFYPSKLVPWSKYLTGVQGQDPGYDPLAFMIEETHARGMEFHAWFNPFRVSVDNKTENLSANNPAVQHPDWVVRHQGKLMFDPGIPAAREHILQAIMEVVNNYDIDGVHLDDYFYPYGQDKEPFADDASYTTYNNGQFSNKGDWRRDNVNQFVRMLGEQIHQSKRHVKYGISPFGVWRNSKLDATGSPTSAGVNSYDDLYADTRTWIQNGWIDYIAPQIYWNNGTKAAPYDKLVDWWVKETKGTNVLLYVGHAAYKLGTTEAGWSSSRTIIDQLDYNRQSGGVAGSLFFRAKNLQANVLGVADQLKTYYSR